MTLSLANKYFQESNYLEAIELYKKILQLPSSKDKHGAALFNLKLMLGRVLDIKIKDIIFNVIKSYYESVQKSCVVLNSTGDGEFRFENISLSTVQGWAINKTNLFSPVFMLMKINGLNFQITNANSGRSDVQKIFGGNGFNGYKFVFPEYIDFDGKSKIELNMLFAASKVMSKHYPKFYQGIHYSSVNEKSEKALKQFHLEEKKTKQELDQLVSFIILNKDGENVLYKCIDAIMKNCKFEYEIIVVDHGSKDQSLLMLESFQDKRIRILDRKKNFGFSESNNFATQHANGTILVFMNNDILITDNAIHDMSLEVFHGDFGLLGIKLWDLPVEADCEYTRSLKVEQHLGIGFRSNSRENIIDAYEIRRPSFFHEEHGIQEVPAVTGALLVIRKDEYIKINGFNEEYFYGQEDVDFCLRYMRDIGRKIGCYLSSGAYHAHGITRKILSTSNKSYINNNRTILQKNLGNWFRVTFRKDLVDKRSFWNPKPLSIAMVVSEVGFDTDKADFFTAKEFGDALELDNCTVGYFEALKSGPIDVFGYDIVLVFIDGFNTNRLMNLSPHTILIAWARNWFDRWCTRTWIQTFDIVLASSEFACDYMSTRLKRDVGLLRIAASNDCLRQIEANDIYKSDYCFTGSYFNSPREITSMLKPDTIPFNFKLYGHNWENHPDFGPYTNGAVSYLDVPKVYASTKLVIDDANIATRDWGAINCRLYDSLAAGVMCITNNVIGVKELFNDDFPTYTNADELNSQVRQLLGDENLRNGMLSKFRKLVLEKHTYANRVSELFNFINDFNKKTKIAIKIGAPNIDRAYDWGDLYFAQSLKYYFEKQNFSVRIDCLDKWYSDRALGDEVVLVLRGLDRYKVNKSQHNIMWLISHPEMVSPVEFEDFDKVFIASHRYCEKVNNLLDTNKFEVLEQASTFDFIGESDEDLSFLKDKILFVGNSRNQFRESVKLAIENGLDLAVYGGGWEQFIDKKYIYGNFIDNSQLCHYYSSAKLVINDHWDDMKRYGFISNRVYDVLASGGLILSDYVHGMEKNNYPNMFYYFDEIDFKSKFDQILKVSNVNSVTSLFNFKSRADVVINYINSVLHE